METESPQEQEIAEEPQPQPSYYAVIPASVRYCRGIPPQAKLLYGEISSLCNKFGYCFANNTYFAELYGVSVRIVQLWISVLQAEGFIKTEVINRNQRKIYLSEILPIVNDGGEVRKNFHTPMKKSSYPHEKNFIHNNKFNNKHNINNNLSFNNSANILKREPTESEQQLYDKLVLIINKKQLDEAYLNLIGVKQGPEVALHLMDAYLKHTLYFNHSYLREAHSTSMSRIPLFRIIDKALIHLKETKFFDQQIGQEQFINGIIQCAAWMVVKELHGN